MTHYIEQKKFKYCILSYQHHNNISFFFFKYLLVTCEFCLRLRFNLGNQTFLDQVLGDTLRTNGTIFCLGHAPNST